MPAGAAVCEACGAAGGEAGERVKPCLGCGALLGFEVLECPECGTAAPLPGPSAERVKECVHCRRIIPFQELYCSQCGEFSVPLGESDIPVLVDLDGAASWKDLAPEIVGLCAYGAGMAAIGVAGVMLFL